MWFCVRLRHEEEAHRHRLIALEEHAEVLGWAMMIPKPSGDVDTGAAKYGKEMLAEDCRW